MTRERLREWPPVRDYFRMRPSRSVLLCLLIACGSADPLQVIAHRGASWDAPEHTFASWDLAIEQGAHWIELDLQLTADAQLVVLHDDSLDRTARGPLPACRGPVRERTRAELAACDVGAWFNAEYPSRARTEFVGQRIPSLEEVLARYGTRARYYIEIKQPDDAPGMEDSLLAVLARHGLAGQGADASRLFVQSFSPTALERLHARAPELRLVQLIDEPIPPDSLDTAFAQIRGYAVGVGPSRRIVSARFVDAAHARGLVVHPYTVNDIGVMRFLLELGVDGMFTDRPRELLAVLSP